MSRKRYPPEKIIGMLRENDIEILHPDTKKIQKAAIYFKLLLTGLLVTVAPS